MSAVILAAAFACLVALAAGPATIRFLYRLRFGQQVREAGPQSHRKKSGTPTMGGVLIIGALTVATLVFAPDLRRISYALFVTLGFAVVGLVDDLIKVVARRSLGLKARHKLAGQLLVSLVLVLFALGEPELGTTLHVPFSQSTWTLPTWLFVPLAVATLLATANAVNETDGLDGLAAGATAIAAFVYAAVALRLGAPDLAVFAGAVGGACLGFSWFNAHPAQVFMGDTGALGLGAALASLAILTGTELFLLIIGGLFVIETLSVILQVAYFRLTGGRRIFKMSPLHHHFELSGWAEPKVVTRFWLIALAFGVVGLLALPSA